MSGFRADGAPRWLESLWTDVRLGVRGLLRSPGTTVAALLALALGIGANAALFGVARATLWRELPVREPERLVILQQEIPGIQQPTEVTGPLFAEWRRRTRSFAGLAALSHGRTNVTSPGRPELVPQAWVTPDFFAVADVKMAAGRGFRSEEIRRKARVAVISQRLFQEHYQGDAARLRQGIVLDGVRYAVVGVAPSGFDLFGDWQVWLPDAFRPGDWRGLHFLHVLGRLQPGVSPEKADPELEAVSRLLAKGEPAVYEGRTVRVTSLTSLREGRLSRPLSLLGLCAAFVLLIACADVAGLLLARGAGREREIAVQATLGAGRGRLARRMLVESLLLFLAGALAGAPLAFWGALGLAAIGPWDVTPAIGPSGGVLLVSLGLGLATGVLFGLMPALSLTGRRLTESLKDTRRFASRWGGRGLRDLLVAGQVALTVILVIGAGLLIRSFDSLRRVDLGIRTSGLLAIDLQLPAGKYDHHPASAQAYAKVLEAVRGTGGVEAAALVDAPPFGMTRVNPVVVEGRPQPRVRAPSLVTRSVSPGYFEILAIPLVKGRLFRDTDGRGAVVISEAMAARYWPDENPLGKRFAIRYNGSEMLTVIGVVGNTRQDELGTVWPEAYLPLLRRPRDAASLLIRAPGDPRRLSDAIAEALRRADPGLAGGPPRLLEDIVADPLAANRFQSRVTLLFATLAVFLAAVGIYGVVSYSVTRRTHEIGLRIALGAEPWDVLRRILLHGMAPVIAGLLLGLGAARLLGGLLADQLHEIRPGDPLTFALAVVVVVSAGLVATYLPAHRATQVDPMAALREE